MITGQLNDESAAVAIALTYERTRRPLDRRPLLATH
jgi:hypothetical protein